MVFASRPADSTRADLYEILGQQQLAIGSIKDVKETIPIGVQHQLVLLSA